TPSWQRPCSTMANSRSVRRRPRCALQAWKSVDERARNPLAEPASDPLMDCLDAVRWNDDGLVPAVAQDAATHRVLTLAWMNREALKRTVQTQLAHYWSRSRA